MLMRFITLILLCAFIQNGNCAKILGIFPGSSKSHWALGSTLFRELARKGHDLTVFSWYEEKNLPSNYSYRTFLLNKEIKSAAVNFFSNQASSPYKITSVMNILGAGLVDQTFAHPELQKLIKNNEKFDIIIQDQFVNDGLAYLAHKFDSHRVLFFTAFACAWVNDLVGNPAPPSVVSEILLDYPTFMTFWQRLQNTIFYVYSELYRQFVFFSEQENVIRKHFPNSKPLKNLNYNVSLVLLNAHESYTDPVVLVPNMKNVGGLHVKPHGDLPENLRKFLDEADEGVVYFSMGSNLKSKDIPEDIRNGILKVFAKLKTKVLWKWEEDILPGQPGNVKLGKWLPQQEILAHPNVKVFITHGGLLSTIEAVYHGKPILAIPVYGDQKANAASAALKGYAINLPYSEFETEKFELALNELLENPKYKENAALRSKLFHDRPRKPLDEAVYWVEYVLRHKGAEHLRVAALNLSWYQYLLLDVAAFLLAVVMIVVFIAKLLFKKLFCTKKIKTQ